MENTYITVEQILQARDRRVARQQALLAQYRQPLICFTMNIAGPIKCSERIRSGFRIGIAMLQDTLKSNAIPILHQEEEIADTGCTAFFVVPGNASALKQLCVGIEDATPLGRLFDMDVICVDGIHISRESLCLAPRKCLICDSPAKICGRSRAHGVQELQEKTDALLRQAVDTQLSRFIGAAAQKALLYEVCTTPKPGLVDCAGSGSHKDMDIFTFMSSTAALGTYFVDCALAGIQSKHMPPQVTFSQLRALGCFAEQDMFRATNGVNTHKGAIFSLGLLCGAAGRLGHKDLLSPSAICATCSAMVDTLTSQDFKHVTEATATTHGQRLYARYGITGIRGQAEAGFPAVLQAGLPTLQKGLGQGFSFHTAGCATLLSLLCCTDDTNLIARSDRDTQLSVQASIAELLKNDPYPDAETLQQLDYQFVQKNLSCGGSADLLAITYFLHFLQE